MTCSLINNPLNDPITNNIILSLFRTVCLLCPLWRRNTVCLDFLKIAGQFHFHLIIYASAKKSFFSPTEHWEKLYSSVVHQQHHCVTTLWRQSWKIFQWKLSLSAWIVAVHIFIAPSALSIIMVFFLHFQPRCQPKSREVVRISRLHNSVLQRSYRRGLSQAALIVCCRVLQQGTVHLSLWLCSLLTSTGMFLSFPHWEWNWGPTSCWLAHLIYVAGPIVAMDETQHASEVIHVKVGAVLWCAVALMCWMCRCQCSLSMVSWTELRPVDFCVIVSCWPIMESWFTVTATTPSRCRSVQWNGARSAKEDREQVNLKWLVSHLMWPASPRWRGLWQWDILQQQAQ